MRKTLAHCPQEATVLAGLLEGLDLMNENSGFSGGARASLTIAALERSRQLAADLERLESGFKTVA